VASSAPRATTERPYPRVAGISMACGLVPRRERSGSRRRSPEARLLPGKRAVNSGRSIGVSTDAEPPRRLGDYNASAIDGPESPPAATLSPSAGATKTPRRCRLERLVDGLSTAVDVENVMFCARVVKHASEESGEVVPRDLTAKRRSGDAHVTSPGRRLVDPVLRSSSRAYFAITAASASALARR
jgi:hypothetical protein